MYLCICVFVYLYLGNEGVVVGEWIVDVISFQKIFGLCGLKCHIVEIWRDVTFEDGQRTDGNVNIVLESAKQDSQQESNTYKCLTLVITRVISHLILWKSK